MCAGVFVLYLLSEKSKKAGKITQKTFNVSHTIQILKFRVVSAWHEKRKTQSPPVLKSFFLHCKTK
jgi:hypothetical protein